MTDCEVANKAIQTAGQYMTLGAALMNPVKTVADVVRTKRPPLRVAGEGVKKDNECSYSVSLITRSASSAKTFEKLSLLRHIVVFAAAKTLPILAISSSVNSKIGLDNC